MGREASLLPSQSSAVRSFLELNFFPQLSTLCMLTTKPPNLAEAGNKQPSDIPLVFPLPSPC